MLRRVCGIVRVARARPDQKQVGCCAGFVVLYELHALLLESSCPAGLNGPLFRAALAFCERCFN